MISAEKATLMALFLLLFSSCEYLRMDYVGMRLQFANLSNDSIHVVIWLGNEAGDVGGLWADAAIASQDTAAVQLVNRSWEDAMAERHEATVLVLAPEQADSLLYIPTEEILLLPTFARFSMTYEELEAASWLVQYPQTSPSS